MERFSRPEFRRPQRRRPKSSALLRDNSTTRQLRGPQPGWSGNAEASAEAGGLVDEMAATPVRGGAGGPPRARLGKIGDNGGPKMEPTFPQFAKEYPPVGPGTPAIDKTTGKVVFDKAAKSGSVDVVIDAKSVDTGYATFNEHIQGEDFLDTAKHPTATFKSTKERYSVFAWSQALYKSISGISKPNQNEGTK